MLLRLRISTVATWQNLSRQRMPHWRSIRILHRRLNAGVSSTCFRMNRWRLFPFWNELCASIPAGAQQCIHFLGMAYLIAEKYTTAAAYFSERIMLVPETDFSRAFLAVALAQIGEAQGARQVWEELKKINPDYSFDEHIERWPFKDTVVSRIKQGLETANLH
jgi:tetratricopeptide (TPR) repeat protein